MTELDIKEQIARIDRELAANHALRSITLLSDEMRTRRASWNDPAIRAALVLAGAALIAALLT